MTTDNAPVLEYGTQPPHRRLRKWAKWLGLAVLLMACLYAAPIAWFYWGWKQEQPARQMVTRVKGQMITLPAGPDFLGRSIPAPLRWTRERAMLISLISLPATDDDLATLRGLRLKWLYLDATGVTDAGLAHLTKFTELWGLSINRTGITDKGLVHLKGLAGLQKLDLDGTQVSDAGLVHLKGLTRLQLLWLQRTQVTDAGVADLQKSLPNCQIIWSSPATAPAGR